MRANTYRNHFLLNCSASNDNTPTTLLRSAAAPRLSKASISRRRCSISRRRSLVWNSFKNRSFSSASLPFSAASRSRSSYSCCLFNSTFSSSHFCRRTKSSFNVFCRSSSESSSKVRLLLFLDDDGVRDGVRDGVPSLPPTDTSSRSTTSSSTLPRRLRAKSRMLLPLSNSCSSLCRKVSAGSQAFPGTDRPRAHALSGDRRHRIRSRNSAAGRPGPGYSSRSHSEP